MTIRRERGPRTDDADRRIGDCGDGTIGFVRLVSASVEPGPWGETVTATVAA